MQRGGAYSCRPVVVTGVSGRNWFLHKEHYFQKAQQEAGESWYSRKHWVSEFKGLMLVVPRLGFMTTGK